MEEHFVKEYRDRTRSNIFKPKEGRFRLDSRKKFFRIRVVKHWKRLGGAVVDHSCGAVVPSLKVFK